MSKPRILVTRRWPEQVERHLQETYDVQLNADDRPLTATELQAAFRDYDAEQRRAFVETLIDTRGSDEIAVARTV